MTPQINVVINARISAVINTRISAVINLLILKSFREGISEGGKAVMVFWQSRTFAVQIRIESVSIVVEVL